MRLLDIRPITAGNTEHPAFAIDRSAWFQNWITQYGQRVWNVGLSCNTCNFLFERAATPATPLQIGAIAERLAQGVDRLDDSLLEPIASALPGGGADAVLLEGLVQRITPGSSADYFAHGGKSFFDDPTLEDSLTPSRPPFYRFGDARPFPSNARPDPLAAFRSPAPDDAGRGGEIELHQFLVPMIDPSSLQLQRIDVYRRAIQGGAKPTALALTAFERRGPHFTHDEHWGLLHFVLDGHHKIEAAAQSGSEIRILAFAHHELMSHRYEQPGAVLRTLFTASAGN